MLPPTPLKPLALSLATLSLASAGLTGDILNGYPVIDSLDLDTVPCNNVTRYYLRMPDVAGNWAQHIPIFVARGFPEGPKLSVSASIHGNELSPVRVAQKTLAYLEANIDSLNGTVIGIPTLNPSGTYLSQREYFEGGNDADYDLNRYFPGAPWTFESPASAASIYTDIVWTALWGNGSNVDVAVDVHTAGAGSYAPLWVYADVRAPYVQRMAELAEPDLLKVDAGEPGSVETTFVGAGIPALTLELGEGLVFTPEYIERGVTFLERLMGDLGMLPTEEVYEADLAETFVGEIFQSLPCQYPGWMESLVSILDDVEEGQEIAKIYNHWGDLLETVTSPVAARVFTVRSDPVIGPGNSVASLIFNSTQVSGCDGGCVISGRELPTGDGEEAIRRRRR